MLFACWVWLNCAFSGFPFKSVADRDKWAKVRRVCTGARPARSLTTARALADESHDNGMERLPRSLWKRGGCLCS